MKNNQRKTTDALLKILVAALRNAHSNADVSAPLLYQDGSRQIVPTTAQIVFSLPPLKDTPFADFTDTELYRCGIVGVPSREEVFVACRKVSRHYDLSRISIFKAYSTGFILNLSAKHFGSSWLLPRVNEVSKQWEGLLVYENLYTEPFLLFPYFYEYQAK